MIDTFVAVCIGLGLAAACGFRVFVPMLVAAVASKAGFLTLTESFDWINSWLAIAVFGIATVVEIGAYYFPWLDNLLDSIATPAAMIAGMIVSAAFIDDMHPLLRWSLVIIAGGGVAGIIKTGLAGLRLASTATTGGGGNLLVSTFEWISAMALSVLSILLPIVAATVTMFLVIFLLRFAIRLISQRRSKSGTPANAGPE